MQLSAVMCSFLPHKELGKVELVDTVKKAVATEQGEPGPRAASAFGR